MMHGTTNMKLVELYLYSPYGPYGLYKGDLYLYLQFIVNTMGMPNLKIEI